MRLIVINLAVILRSIWVKYNGNKCIYTCAYKFGVGMGISRIFAVLVIRQNDLPPIYDWCARATFYRTLLSVQGIERMLTPAVPRHGAPYWGARPTASHVLALSR